MSDQLFDGRPFWILTVVECHSRELLAIVNEHWFLDLDDAGQKTEAWRRNDNEASPHEPRSAVGRRWR